jgi:hypothetical protein
VQPPQTQYVERDGISIAYQVVGDNLFPELADYANLPWFSRSDLTRPRL